MNLLWKLFLTFFQIGLFSIGGGYAVIPMIQAYVAEKNAWITTKAFTDMITISQMTPGPIAVNTSTFTGLQIAGIPGAVIATLGCVIPGICISAALCCFFLRRRKSLYTAGALLGLKSASAGLIASAAATILLLTFTGESRLEALLRPDWIAVVLFAAAFCVLRKWKLNPILLMAITGAAGGTAYLLIGFL
ncbi:MAG: chromate transporter [Clostridia bacterium]